MDLSDIASISGKGGLFKVLKPSRTGVVIESMDKKKGRMVVNLQQRVSILEEISIYTTTAEGSIPLSEIFPKIYEEFGDDPGIDNKSDNDELRSFIRHLLPDYDEDRVYPSDVKKLVSWYKIILAFYPERFTATEEEGAAEEAPAEEAKEEKPKAKAKAKKDDKEADA